MNKNQVYFSGVPIGPDVNKLINEFGLPVENTEISYDRISKLIGVTYQENRFRTITNAWQRWLRAHNIELVTIPGLAFVVADPDTRMKKSSKGIKEGFRKVMTHLDITTRTDRTRLTSDESRHEYDTHLKMYGPLRLLGATEPRQNKYVSLETKK